MPGDMVFGGSALADIRWWGVLEAHGVNAGIGVAIIEGFYKSSLLTLSL